VWAMPPEVAGLPTWVLNGLSVGGLVMFILVGLATSRLWTRHQVDLLTTQHQRESSNLVTQHEREMTNLRDRYENHIQRTVDLYQGRVEDAIRREQEWHQVADKWQQVATLLSDSIDPLHEQSKTMMTILQTWQVANRQGRRS
jgi:transposase